MLLNNIQCSIFFAAVINLQFCSMKPQNSLYQYLDRAVLQHSFGAVTPYRAGVSRLVTAVAGLYTFIHTNTYIHTPTKPYKN